MTKIPEKENPSMIKRLLYSRQHFNERDFLSTNTIVLTGISNPSFGDIWLNDEDDKWDKFLKSSSE